MVAEEWIGRENFAFADLPLAGAQEVIDPGASPLFGKPGEGMLEGPPMMGSP